MTTTSLKETFTSSDSGPAVWLTLNCGGPRCGLELTVDFRRHGPVWDAASVEVLFQPCGPTGLPEHDTVVLHRETVLMSPAGAEVQSGFLWLPKSIAADRLRRCYFRVVPATIEDAP
jgi:hypothetical protein